jgi:hypothetical protein
MTIYHASQIFGVFSVLEDALIPEALGKAGIGGRMSNLPRQQGSIPPQTADVSLVSAWLPHDAVLGTERASGLSNIANAAYGPESTRHSLALPFPWLLEERGTFPC